jgi:hypothetical protein
MATAAAWATGYARQADADFKTFEAMQSLPIPDCHKLHFLQMACEKRAKASLCGEGMEPAALRTSHAYVAGTLPVVLRQQAVFVNFTGGKAQAALSHAQRLAHEIEVLAPAVDRDGQRPDNCEYPWENANGNQQSPLDWSFYPSQLMLVPSGPTVLKLIRGAINRLV